MRDEIEWGNNETSSSSRDNNIHNWLFDWIIIRRKNKCKVKKCISFILLKLACRKKCWWHYDIYSVGLFMFVQVFTRESVTCLWKIFLAHKQQERTTGWIWIQNIYLCKWAFIFCECKWWLFHLHRQIREAERKSIGYWFELNG